jgi:hypothetical protein
MVPSKCAAHGGQPGAPRGRGFPVYELQRIPLDERKVIYMLGSRFRQTQHADRWMSGSDGYLSGCYLRDSQ